MQKETPLEFALLPVEEMNTQKRGAFPYTAVIERISAPTGGNDEYLISGHVTNLGDNVVAVGGHERGSLNLGFRLVNNISSNILFEDRALLSVSQLAPGEETRFSARFPKMDIAEAVVQLDFVCEEEYWFKELTADEVYQIPVTAFQLLDDAPKKSKTPRSGKTPGKSVDTPPHNAAKTKAAGQEDPILRYVFDISDLIQFWHDNIRPTGIQRVQIEVLREIIMDRVDADLVTLPWIAIYFQVASHSWTKLAHSALLEQIEMSASPGITKEEWLRHLQGGLGLSTAYNAEPGDAIINLGSSWWIPDYLHKIKMLRRDRRVCYIPFVHDVIPLVAPEYCAAGLVEEFRMWFRGAASIADHIIVNSDCSARDVAIWANNLHGSCSEISVVSLNAAFVRPLTTTHTGIRERYNLDVDRYVLCVGTLEVRKNHLLLLRIWNELAHELPNERVPKLVLVGKEGWMFEAASAMLGRSQSLSENVIMLSNLSDEELSEIYEHCIFTVYPSFYEGWGLPVTEALSYGKLTVASNTSSIPEAASSGDILLDPQDYLGWYETIAKLVDDDHFLASATAISAQRADLRKWSDVANDILRAAKNSRHRLSDNRTPPIQDGIIYDFRVGTARQKYDCSAYGFRFGSGWHHLEEWGTWSAAGVTELKFSVSSQSPRYLYLVICGSPGATDASVFVDGRLKLKRNVPADNRIIFRLSLTGNGKLEHTVRFIVHDIFDLGATPGAADPRKIGVGFLNMMCCQESDLAARINFNEAMQMHFI